MKIRKVKGNVNPVKVHFFYLVEGEYYNFKPVLSSAGKLEGQ